MKSQFLKTLLSAALTLGALAGHAQVNQPPSVAITSPESNQSYVGPATVPIRVTATDADGTVTKVQYYSGTTLLGTTTVAPHSFNWTNVPAATYSITAKATDNAGAVTTSTASVITVAVNKAPVVSLTEPANGTNYLTAPATVVITATAADSDGSVAKVDFYNGTTLLGTRTVAPYSLTWSSVTAGGYSITAKATDNQGMVGSTASVITVGAVNKPPTISVATPTNGSNLAAPATVSITATATDSDGTIAKVEYYNGASLLVSAAVAPYRAVWGNLPAGSYTLTAKAIDNHGGAASSAPVTFTVGAANSAPTVSLATPVSGASYTAPAVVAISATAADSDGTIAKVEYYNGASLLGTSTAAPYSFTWSNVVAGSYSITAKATDNKGSSTTSAVRTITVGAANKAPTISLTAPVAGASYSAPATVTITANAADSDGTVAKVEYYNGATLLGSTTTAPYSFSWTNVVAGSYSLTAKATDNKGAVTTSAAAAITVGAANNVPTVTLTSPAVGASFTAPATVTIAATASDSDGSVAKVEYYNGATLLGTSTTAPYSYSWINVPAGSYSLTAKATDNKGAVKTSAAAAITVGAANNAPTVTLTAPGAGASFTAPATVAITATASDSDGTVAKVEYYSGATLLGTSTATPYSYSWTNVAAGSYSLTAKATDNNGAVTTSATVNIAVSAAPVAATTLYYVHPDHLGTPRLIADQSKKTVWRWDNQEAFGLTGLNEDPDQDTKKVTFNLRFAGQYHDQESGLHYNGYRDYDPGTGRYVQTDPIGLGGGISLYGYVSGNPLSFIDPLGLAKCETTRVRHYTNRKGSETIEQDGVIRARDNNRVYVESADKKPLSQLDAEDKYQIKRGRGRDYVETDVDSSRIEIVDNPRYGTPEMTVKGDVKLENANIVRRR